MSCAIVGAVIGLWYGYTARLSPLQKGRMALMLKIASLLMIFWSFYQFEMALLICCLTLSNLPSFLVYYLLGLVLPYEIMRSWLNVDVVDPLVETYRREPQLLSHLEPADRKKYLTLLNDEHLNVVFEHLDVEEEDEEYSSDDDDSDLDGSEDD